MTDRQIEWLLAAMVTAIVGLVVGVVLYANTAHAQRTRLPHDQTQDTGTMTADTTAADTYTSKAGDTKSFNIEDDGTVRHDGPGKQRIILESLDGVGALDRGFHFYDYNQSIHQGAKFVVGSDTGKNDGDHGIIPGDTGGYHLDYVDSQGARYSAMLARPPTHTTGGNVGDWNIRFANGRFRIESNGNYVFESEGASPGSKYVLRWNESEKVWQVADSAKGIILGHGGGTSALSGSGGDTLVNADSSVREFYGKAFQASEPADADSEAMRAGDYDSDLDQQVEDADNVTSTYKGNDLDSNGDGTVDRSDASDTTDQVEAPGGETRLATPEDLTTTTPTAGSSDTNVMRVHDGSGTHKPGPYWWDPTVGASGAWRHVSDTDAVDSNDVITP